MVDKGPDRAVGELRKAARARRVALEIREPQVVEPVTSESTRFGLDPRLLRDLLVLGPPGGPKDEGVRCRVPSSPGFEALSLL